MSDKVQKTAGRGKLGTRTTGQDTFTGLQYIYTLVSVSLSWGYRLLSLIIISYKNKKQTNNYCICVFNRGSIWVCPPLHLATVFEMIKTDASPSQLCPN